MPGPLKQHVLLDSSWLVFGSGSMGAQRHIEAYAVETSPCVFVVHEKPHVITNFCGLSMEPTWFQPEVKT